MKIITKYGWRVIHATLLIATPNLQILADNLVQSPIAGEQQIAVAENSVNINNRGDLAITQGDILINPSPQHSSLPLLRGLARNTKNDKWRNGLVHYQFDASLSAEKIAYVQTAIDHWNDRSTISLVERADDSITDYINFESASGCASWVGRIGGEQVIWIGPNCDSGSMIHEIGHAVGLFHEHTRADRDNYITVEWNNVIPGKELNFDIYTADTELVGDYDYDSIMHYGSHFFTSNGNSTISVPDGVSIGQRIKLSERDLTAVANMYETDLSLVTSTESGNGQSVTLDVMVTNQGLMGAHDLEFSLPLTVDATVTSTESTDWNCSTETELLKCTLYVLADGASSQLNIELESEDSLVEDGAAFLVSKTHDYDLSNNGSVPASEPESQPDSPPNQQPEPELGAGQEGDTPDEPVIIITDPPPEVKEPQGPVPVDPGSGNPPTVTETPSTGMATGATDADLNPTPAELFSAAAGSMNWLLLALLPMLLHRRRLDNHT